MAESHRQSGAQKAASFFPPHSACPWIASWGKHSKDRVTGKEMSAVPLLMLEGSLSLQTLPDAALSAQAAKLHEPGFPDGTVDGITKLSTYLYSPKKINQQFCSK